MAESEAVLELSDQRAPQNEAKKLKYLELVQLAAAYVVVCFSTLYEYAKENSGPLRPGVQTVEGTVRTVIGPVCQKFRNVPSDLLRFVDFKVDEFMIELDNHLPLLVKQFLSRYWATAQRVPAAAQELAFELQRDGFTDMASNMAKTACAEYGPKAKELYDKYEPIVEQHMIAGWRTLNELPLMGQVVHIMVPTVADWTEKYNQAVANVAARGYTVSSYFPLVPVERIAKIFVADDNEPEPAVSNNAGYVVVT